MMTYTEARTFEISKLKNFQEKPRNPPEVTRICKNLGHDPSKHNDVVTTLLRRRYPTSL